MRFFLLSALLHLLAGTLLAHAQIAGPPPTDPTIDAAARAEVIDGALAALDDGYVFPDVAKKMAEAIRARQQRKEYDAITSGREFAQVLTEHLREVSHDRHLRVDFIQQGPPPPPPPGGAPDARRPAADHPGAPEFRLRPRRAAGRQHRLPGPARIHAAGGGWRDGHRSDDVSRQHRRRSSSTCVRTAAAIR